MNIEEISIEETEEGFHLLLWPGDGGAAYNFNIQNVAEQLYDRVKGAIGPWLRERDEALRSMPNADDLADWRYEVANEDTKLDFETWRDHRDEAMAHDISDPKHPDHHSVHADIWDAREGK